MPGPRPRRAARASYYEPRLGAYAVPFLGADASVLRRTAGALAAASEPAYHAAVWLTLPSRRALYTYLLFGSVFLFLARRPWGRTLLLRFPRLFTAGCFSHAGPTERQLAETSFAITFFASGDAAQPPAPGDARRPHGAALAARVSGPESGYVATPTLAVAAAETLLAERGALGTGPGCATPAALFRGRASWSACARATSRSRRCSRCTRCESQQQGVLTVDLSC